MHNKLEYVRIAAFNASITSDIRDKKPHELLGVDTKQKFPFESSYCIHFFILIDASDCILSI